MQLCIYVLGTFHVRYDGQPVGDFRSEREKALLAYLALERHRPHRREELTGLLWPELTDDNARNNLRVSLHRLRKGLAEATGPTEWLLVEREGVRVNDRADPWVDLIALEDHVRQAQQLRQARGPAEPERLRHLAAVAELYAGDFLEGFTVDHSPALTHWVAGHRERAHRLALGALYDLAELHLWRGELRRALGYAQRQLALEPWREEAHRQMMHILARGGQRSAALAQFERCRAILSEELGVEPEEETQALHRRLQRLRAKPLHALPSPPTPFFGRRDELAEVAWRLADPTCRLLTLTGPGGAGKSRLALQAAANQGAAFLDGVAFVPLAGLASADLLPASLAETLGVAPYQSGESATAALLNYLHEKELLLVLDGFEHLLAGRPLLSELLRAAPGVKLLVTSRERLAMQQEWVFSLGGLTAGNEPADATQFFLQSARRVRPGFVPSDDERACIAGICQLVDGLPLAIELCAAWMGSLDCGTLRHNLQDSLASLESPWADSLDRHRSLRATFEHSWQLIAPHEREALAQLSVFAGSFDRQAAAQVAGVSPLALAGLVDKSLLRWVDDGRTPGGRYDVPNMICQLAAEKLAESGDDVMARAQARHGGYYTRFLGARAGHMGGAGQHRALEEVRHEVDNVRAAFGWAIEHRAAEALSEASYTLLYFYEVAGLFEEAYRVFGEALAALERPLAGVAEPTREATRALGWALAGQGWFAMRLGRALQAIDLLQRALDIARELNDPTPQVYALQGVGAAYMEHGDLETARAYLQQCDRLAAEIDHHNRFAALALLGGIALIQGDIASARRLLGQSLAIVRRNGDLWSIAITLSGLADMALVSNELDEAEALIRESLGLQQAIGHGWRQADNLLKLGHIAAYRGSPAQAREHYRDAVILLKEAGERKRLARGLLYLGEAHAMLDEPREAEQEFREALALAGEAGMQAIAAQALVSLSAVLLTEGREVQAAELLGAALGHEATEEAVRLRAETLLSRLTLPPETLAAALARGGSLTPVEAGQAYGPRAAVRA